MAILPTKSVGEWLSPSDAATILGVQSTSISKLARKRKFRTKWLNSQRLLYCKDDILKRAETTKRGQKQKTATTGAATTKPAATKKWFTIAEAATVTGLTPSGVGHAARKKHIKRKKLPGLGYMYRAADVVAYKQIASPRIIAPKAKAASAPQTHGPKTRGPQTRGPKTRQQPAALTKARWVFEGMEIGAIPASAALDILRSIVYEEGGDR